MADIAVGNTVLPGDPLPRCLPFTGLVILTTPAEVPIFVSRLGGLIETMDGLFRFILFSDQHPLLYLREISAAKLVPADPGDSFKPVLEFLFPDLKCDLGMLLKDPIAVMPVNDHPVPYDHRTEQRAFRQDIGFQLRIFLLRQRGDLLGKLRIDLQIL